MSDTELAWAAGFLDGEGCFHARSAKGKVRARYWAVSFSITQKYPEVLYRFQRAVGCGVVNGPYTYDGYTHYSYRASGRDRTRLIAEMLWPYLSMRKKLQALGVARKIQSPA